MSFSINFYRCGLIFSRMHSACHKSLPYQLVQAELISRKRFFYLGRCQIHISRADGFMCILGIFPVLRHHIFLDNIFFSVIFRNKGLAGRICLFRYTGRIRTKVSNKTDGAMAFYLNTFVELLCDLHGFSSSKVQLLGCFLLQSRCCKWKGWLFISLTFFNGRNFVSGSL